MRILYIDDEHNTDRFQSKLDLLRDEGFEIDTIGEVEEVEPYLRKHHQSLDAIILDILMPPHDYYKLEETNEGTTTGLRLLEDIRRSHPSIPILIVSVKRGLDPELLSGYSVSEYLEKPALPSEIAKAIKRAIGSKSSRR